MSFIAKDAGGGDFVPTPAGTHVARCIWILDIGVQPSAQFKPRAKTIFGFELVEELMDDGRPYMVLSMYTNSLNEKASLSIMLEGWRGKSFTDEERKNGYNYSTALGQACQVSIKHTEKNGKTYANLVAVTKPPKGVKVPEAANPTLLYSVDEPDHKVFVQLPKWIQEKITSRIIDDEPEQAPPIGDAAPFDDEIPF